MSYGYGEFEGLVMVGQISLEDEPWQFSYLGVWKDENGGYYLSTDSGYSCPTPWESTQREDLTGPLTREQAVEESTSIATTSWRDDYASANVAAFWEGE